LSLIAGEPSTIAAFGVSTRRACRNARARTGLLPSGDRSWCRWWCGGRGWCWGRCWARV